MTIEKSKAQPTVTGGMRMMLCPNGLYAPFTFGVSRCLDATCKCTRPFDHIELLARMRAS